MLNGIRGIYKRGSKFRVMKYGVHLGMYDTFEEAKQVVKEAEKYHNQNK